MTQLINNVSNKLTVHLKNTSRNIVVLSCHLHCEDKQFPVQTASAQLAAGTAAPAQGAAGEIGRVFLGDSDG